MENASGDKDAVRDESLLPEILPSEDVVKKTKKKKKMKKLEENEEEVS